MAKVNWKTASNRRVVGEWVELKSLPGIDARVKPRKYSQAGADEINAWAVSRARFKRDTEGVTDEARLLDVFASTDPEMLKQAGYMGIVLRFGIAEYQFGDEAGPPSDAWINDVLDDVELTTELLGIVAEFNRPLAQTTSGTSETSPAGSSKE